MSKPRKKIWFVMGTAGELIKVYPVLKLLDDKGMEWGLIHTGQSGVNFWRQWEQFGFSDSHIVIKLFDRGCDLVSSKGALGWFFRFLFDAKDELLGQQGEKPAFGDFFVVHGDTLSTLAGSVLSWRFAGELFHIEAGLRSESLFEPFPEELNRRITSNFVDVHYPPDQKAADNLFFSGTGGEIISTKANTLLDAIRLANSSLDSGKASAPYVVANLHRFENLSSEARWQCLIDTVLKAQKDFPVVFAMHPPTKQKLQEDSEAKTKLLAAGVELRERIPFFEFVNLLHNAEYVLSDGGSNQEECFYMGIPCLIMRETTERSEGLGENAVLSRMDTVIVDNFLSNYRSFRRESLGESFAPSELIVDDLSARLDVHRLPGFVSQGSS